MKKILSLALAIMMIVALGAVSLPALADEEPVLLTYYTENSSGEQEYTQQVADKLSEMLQAKGINVKIELHPYASGGSYKTGFTLAQTSGQQIDLFTTYNIDFTTEVENGSVMPLDDLLAAHPDVVAEVPEWLVKMGRVNGTQYYIPTYQQATNGRYFIAPNAYLEAANLTIEDVRKVMNHGTTAEKLDLLEKYCRDVRTATGKDTKWISMPPFYAMSWVEYIDSNYGDLILREGAEGPEYWPLTDDAKIMYEYAAKWYKEGLIHPDVMTYNGSDFRDKNFLNDEALIVDWPESTSSEEMVINSRAWTQEVPSSCCMVFDHWYIGSKWAAGGNAIFATCEHPDEAMEVIRMLMTKEGEEIYNTLVWGLEGIHYEWVDRSIPRIKTLEYDSSQANAGTSTYDCRKWMVGNTFNCWLNQAMADDNYCQWLLDNVHNAASTTTSKVMGYTWNLMDTEDERAACKAVRDEYNASLSNGIYGDDWEAKYEEYIAKLNASGLQNILDSVTEQYNSYVGK